MFYFLIFLIGMVLMSGVTCYWQRGWYNFCQFNQRSTCSDCHKILTCGQLIPVVGWIMQQGYCQNCQQPIHLIYPAMEIFGGLWSLVMAIEFTINDKMALLTLTGLLMGRLIYIDVMTYRLPQIYTIVIGLLGCYDSGEWSTSLCLGTSFWLIKKSYRWVAKKNVLGMGDVKLAYAIGLWLPLDLIAYFYFITGIIGMLWGHLWYRQFHVKKFPFAPCLLLSFTCVYLYKIANSH